MLVRNKRNAVVSFAEVSREETAIQMAKAAKIDMSKSSAQLGTSDIVALKEIMKAIDYHDAEDAKNNNEVRGFFDKLKEVYSGDDEDIDYSDFLTQTNNGYVANIRFALDRKCGDKSKDVGAAWEAVKNQAIEYSKNFNGLDKGLNLNGVYIQNSDGDWVSFEDID